MSRTLLATDLAVTAIGEKFEKDYDKLATPLRPALVGFVESLIFQDKIVIPFNDFTTLLVLFKEFKKHNFINLIKDGTIELARYQGMLGFAAEKGYEIGGATVVASLVSHQVKNVMQSRYADLECALDHAIGSSESCKIKDSQRKFIINHVKNIDIKKKTADNTQETKSDLHNLTGLAFGSASRDGIAALAQFNFEMAIGRQFDCTDYSISDAKHDFVKLKIDRLSRVPQLAEIEAKVARIAGFRNLGEMVLGGSVPFDAVIRLRNSKDGEQFRAWFNSIDQDALVNDADYIARQLSDLLSQSREITENTLFKTIRFLGTQVLTSYVEPLSQWQTAGLMLSVFDTFFLDKLIRRKSPRFFLNELKNLVDQDINRKTDM